MLGISSNSARNTWTAVIVLLGLYLVYLVRSTLFIFTLALLFAYLLTPLVNLLDRFLPASRTRTPALALSYLIFVALAVFLAVQIGSTVVEQAKQLARDFPPKITLWMQTPGDSPTLNTIKQKVLDKVHADVDEWSTALLSALPQAGLRFITVASDLIYVVIIPVLAFFFLKDGHLIREHMLDLLDDGPRRALLDDVLADIHLLLAHYMRALVMLSLATFTAGSIFFSIMGVPYGVLLAAVAGMLEFIPMVGPLTGGLLVLVISAVSGAHLLAVVIFMVALRMFQDYFLSPRLMGRGVELHPLMILFGVFAGAEVAGVAGTFLSVPVLAMVRILYIRIRKARHAPQRVPAASAGPAAS